MTCTNFIARSNLIFKYAVGDLATPSSLRAFGSSGYVIKDGLDHTMSGMQLNIETFTSVVMGMTLS